jgi:hypothetical protein
MTRKAFTERKFAEYSSDPLLKQAGEQGLGTNPGPIAFGKRR